MKPSDESPQRMTPQETIERYWKKEQQGDGSYLYWDGAAGLWLTMEEALSNSAGRQNFRRIMGDYADHRAAERYEQQLDKDDRRA